jgi:hypothetical protein
VIRAKDVVAALSAFSWNRLTPVREAAAGQSERADAAQDILDNLTKALNGHEHAYACAKALKTAEDAIFDWLASAPVPDPPRGVKDPIVPPPVVVPEPTKPDDVTLPKTDPPADSHPGGPWRTTNANTAVDELQKFLRENPGRRIEVQWRIVE